MSIQIMVLGATQERAERKLKGLLNQLQYDALNQDKELNILRSVDDCVITDEYIIRAKTYSEHLIGYRYHTAYVDELIEQDEEQEEYIAQLRANIVRSVLNHNQQIYKFKLRGDN